MYTLCGSGASTASDTRKAVAEALEQALAKFGGRTPSLGFLFVAPERGVAGALSVARERLRGIDFVGCSTAGEITERGLSHGGVACLLVGWGKARHELSIVRKMDAPAKDIAQEICDAFDASAEGHRVSGRGVSTCLILGDGLSPNFEKLVVEIRRKVPEEQLFVGAGAADEGHLARTVVGANGLEFSGGVVALHVYSQDRWGAVVEHGLEVVSPRMTITKAAGNVVMEIDGKPALSVYKKFARERGVELKPEDVPRFLMEHELGVLLFEQVVRVRAPIRVEPNGALFFAGEVPEGSNVCVVRGEPDAMTEGARVAARTAREELGASEAAGVLVFSCICRGTTFGSRYDEEIAAIRQVFPEAPIAGFLSYGEVARSPGKLDGYHNNTVVVVAIPRGA